MRVADIDEEVLAERCAAIRDATPSVADIEAGLPEALKLLRKCGWSLGATDGETTDG